MNDDRADLHRDRTPTGRLDEAVPGTAVKPLSHLHNYRISQGDPDVRGWEVFGADGRKMGQVDDLLVDTEALRVRYLDVCLDLNLFEERAGTGAGTERLGGDQALSPQAETGTAALGASPFSTPLSAASAMGGLGSLMSEAMVRSTLSDEENQLTQEHHHGFNTRHVLIPVGNARLDPEHDRILVQGMPAADAAGLPDYNGENLDRDYETGLRRRLDPSYTQAPEREFYAHDLYDQDRFYGPRRQTARTAGLEPGGSARDSSGRDREITGELDREAALPDRGRS
ncbi:MAG TPA: PRC-barrel domain-containing protein [Thermoanaerobaculia bacterium]|jgi:hypothetical protein|nr:PRC-barrel domain-containing protein [Thermoanaerobaculia bacterium]